MIFYDTSITSIEHLSIQFFCFNILLHQYNDIRLWNYHENNVFYWDNGIIFIINNSYDNHQYILMDNIDLYFKKNLPYKIDVKIA